MSKNNIYYPPKLNLDKNQTIDSLLIELDKVELFLRAPEYSYLFKEKYKSLSKYNWRECSIKNENDYEKLK